MIMAGMQIERMYFAIGPTLSGSSVLRAKRIDDGQNTQEYH
jgi:hypothetical protein